jgi:hypothetical protein
MARRKPAASDQAIETAGEPADQTTIETGADTDPPPQAADDPIVKAAPAKSKSNTPLILALGAILGMGMAALGYGAALTYPLVGAAPASVGQAALAELAAKVGSVETDLKSRIAAVESAPTVPPDTSALEARIATLEAKLAAAPPNSDLRAELADIRTKLAQSDPAPAIKAAIAAQMGAVEKTAQDMVAHVNDAANQAAQLSAMTLLQAALDTGAPYASASAQIALPEVLAANAEAGIPSLTHLRETFPDAARAGLDAALKSNMGETWGERITNFVRSQTGARALTPREGNDPDAVLSRIDAGLTGADMQAVVTELAALPAAAQTAMQAWINQAKLRADALAEFAKLTKEGM